MKTHRFDILSFLAGLIMTMIGLAFLLVPGLSGLIDLVTNAGSWFWPIVFIAVGIAILAPVAIGRNDATGAVDSQVSEPLTDADTEMSESSRD